VKSRGFQHVVLLGMGGSSLGPEVLAETFGPQSGWPKFYMLDATDPAQIRTIDGRSTSQRHCSSSPQNLEARWSRIFS
jgi:glucose-6-phosphate isomerase